MGHHSPVYLSTFHLWVLPFGLDHAFVIPALWFLPVIKLCKHRFSLSNTYSLYCTVLTVRQLLKLICPNIALV